MSVTSVDDVRALVPAASGLSDEALKTVIDRIEAEIAALIGAAYVDADTSIEVTLSGGGKFLALPRAASRVVQVTVYLTPDDTGRALEDSEYVAWLDEGLLERYGALWEPRVVVAFVPVDDRARWKQVVIDLVRLDVERTALFQESVGGEYSFTAPDWERERRKILRRLTFATAG